MVLTQLWRQKVKNATKKKLSLCWLSTNTWRQSENEHRNALFEIQTSKINSKLNN